MAKGRKSFGTGRKNPSVGKRARGAAPAGSAKRSQHSEAQLSTRPEPAVHLILETKGYDELAEVREAAVRWVTAVNADGRWGHWEFRMARKMEDVSQIISDVAPRPTGRA